MTEDGTTFFESKKGKYTFSFVQIKNSSIIFDYNFMIKDVERKKINEKLNGIILKITNVLKIFDDGTIHSNSMGYPGLTYPGSTSVTGTLFSSIIVAFNFI